MGRADSHSESGSNLLIGKGSDFADFSEWSLKSKAEHVDFDSAIFLTKSET